MASCVVAASVAAPTVAPAHADTVKASPTSTGGYEVTMVARWCGAYTDVFGNRARNDIMESLRDLGPDTPYSSFVSVQPSVEDGLAPQSTCHPLSNWTFAFGNGYGRPVAGTNLSYVNGTSSVANRQVTTKSSTPLLDDQGNVTGNTIAGAATFTLTNAEAQLASQNNKFWVMGGTPTDPLNGQTGTYGFAALRCAKDNLNGDNVEYIAYPSGVRHVFCYAFYVKPPPEAGVINIVKKYPNGVTLPAARSFQFDGNLSFNTNGEFSLEVPANANTSGPMEFVRGAGGAPWVVNEIVPDGFDFVSVTCVSTNQRSQWTPTKSSVSIHLGAGDHITCTFVNDLAPPPAGKGQLLKAVVGDPFGVPPTALPANWSFNVTDPQDGNHNVSLPVDTATGVADSGPISDLSAGTWTIAETIPAPTPSVAWQFVAALCESNGDSSTQNIVVAPAPPTITVTVPANGHAACVFLNRMIATSGLTIRLTTKGGTGTFGFAVQGAGDENIGGTNDGVVLNQQATTLAAGARVVATGDSTQPLYGTWLVSPIIPAATSAGHWVLDSTPVCADVAPVAVGSEQVTVDIGAAHPQVVCDYVYRLVPPSTLDVVKFITGDRSGQVDPVSITVVCNDGTSAALAVPTDAASPASLTPSLTFSFPTLCSVDETNDGGGGAPVGTTVSVFVNGAASRRPADELSIGTDTSAEHVAVHFTNEYAAVSPPTTSPNSGPTTTGVLPATGGGHPWAITSWALALLALGTALLALRGRNRRTVE
jgi:hypothetical protein